MHECILKYFSHLKISDPLRTLCLLLGSHVCEEKMCACAWQVSAGLVCQTFYLSSSLCVNECLTADGHYKILHVVEDRPLRTDMSVFFSYII